MTVLYCVTETRLVECGTDTTIHRGNGHTVERLELKERRRRGPHGFEYQLSTDWKLSDRGAPQFPTDPSPRSESSPVVLAGGASGQAGRVATPPLPATRLTT